MGLPIVAQAKSAKHVIAAFLPIIVGEAMDQEAVGRDTDGQRAILARVAGTGHVAGVAAGDIATHNGSDLSNAERERVRVHDRTPNCSLSWIVVALRAQVLPAGENFPTSSPQQHQPSRLSRANTSARRSPGVFLAMML